jgi:ABC-2 type transport system ATP-binding protein
MSDIAISIDKLTRDFGPVRALDGLSLEVTKGTIFGFLGPNGAGKTTTINILLGLLEPTSGSVKVMNLDTKEHAADIRSLSGALLEHNGLYEQLSAEDNLEFYGRVWHLNDNERRVRIKELLTKIDLWDRRKEKVFHWSKGMKQKLALARVIMHKPELVILDEPTVGLDVVAANSIRNDLASLAGDKGTTIFMATHNMTEAEKLCNTVAVIRHGKLLAIGDPEELKMRPSSAHNVRVEIIGQGFNSELVASITDKQKVSVTESSERRLILQFDGEADTAPIISLLVAGGAQVEEVNKSKASLEDIFLSLVEE